MTYFYFTLAGFIVGAGLTYGFRGWIERRKQATIALEKKLKGAL
jgi:hypothetical protein